MFELSLLRILMKSFFTLLYQDCEIFVMLFLWEVLIKWCVIMRIYRMCRSYAVMRLNSATSTRVPELDLSSQNEVA